MQKCEIITGYQLSYEEQRVEKHTPVECMELKDEGLYTCFVRNPVKSAVPRKKNHNFFISRKCISALHVMQIRDNLFCLIKGIFSFPEIYQKLKDMGGKNFQTKNPKKGNMEIPCRYPSMSPKQDISFEIILAGIGMGHKNSLTWEAFTPDIIRNVFGLLLIRRTKLHNFIHVLSEIHMRRKEG